MAISEMNRPTTADVIPDSHTMMKALVYHGLGKRAGSRPGRHRTALSRGGRPCRT